MRLPADVRDALRALTHRPAYTLVSVLTFAIGIGANLAIFSLANVLLLRPVPGTTDPGRLVRIMRVDRQTQASSPMSYPLYETMRDGIPALSGLATYVGAVPDLTFPGDPIPHHVRAQLVTGNYFEVIGAHIGAGRGLTDEDDSPRAQPVVVISHAFWRDTLGSDAGFPGKTVLLNGHPYAVVGIAAEAFRGHTVPASIDVWAAISRHRDLAPTFEENLLRTRATSFLFDVIGRLAPGATLARVQAQADAVGQQIASWNRIEELNAARRRFVVSEGIGLPPNARTRVIGALRLLGAAVVLLLALACLNVASLWRARAADRQRDLAVRRALGAAPWRIVRGLMLEYGLIALASGGAGLLSCLALARPLGQIRLVSYLPPLGDVSPDWRIFVAAVAASLLCGLAAGLLPAIASSRRDPLADIKNIGTAVRPNVGYILAGGQLALSLALLVGAELLLGTVHNLLAVDLGYQPRGLVTAAVNPSSHGYSHEQTLAFYRALLDRLKQAPGLDASALALTAPFSGFTSQVRVSPAVTASDGIRSYLNQVTGDYFQAIGLRLVAGRAFTREEEFFHHDSGAAIVSRSLARQMYGNETIAVGKLIVLSGTPPTPRPIVGVAADARMADVKSGPELEVYTPLGQSPQPLPLFVSVHVRSARSLREVADAVQREVSALDPSLPVTQVSAGADAITAQLSEERVMAWTIGTFAVLALVLAAVGVYGVMAYAVASRTREFGIRTALGATPARVMTFVLCRAFLVGICGLVAGLACAAVLARTLASRLFGIAPFDLGTFVIAGALLLGIALLAAAVPARRAARVDPLIALRSE